MFEFICFLIMEKLSFFILMFKKEDFFWLVKDFRGIRFLGNFLDVFSLMGG